MTIYGELIIKCGLCTLNHYIVNPENRNDRHVLRAGSYHVEEGEIFEFSAKRCAHSMSLGKMNVRPIIIDSIPKVEGGNKVHKRS